MLITQEHHCTCTLDVPLIRTQICTRFRWADVHTHTQYIYTDHITSYSQYTHIYTVYATKYTHILRRRMRTYTHRHSTYTPITSPIASIRIYGARNQTHSHTRTQICAHVYTHTQELRIRLSRHLAQWHVGIYACTVHTRNQVHLHTRN